MAFDSQDFLPAFKGYLASGLSKWRFYKARFSRHFVGVDIHHLRSDGFTTKHGAAVDSSDATVVEVPIGLRAGMNFDMTDGTKAAPSFPFAVVQAFGDTDIDVQTAFAGARSNDDFMFADDVRIRTNLGTPAAKKNLRIGAYVGCGRGNEGRSGVCARVEASFLV